MRWLMILMLWLHIIPYSMENEFDKTDRLLNELDTIIHEQGEAWENK